MFISRNGFWPAVECLSVFHGRGLTHPVLPYFIIRCQTFQTLVTKQELINISTNVQVLIILLRFPTKDKF